jgi:peptidoglycan/xylan/chitin deacetylase (PgdA/CDA1 family)
MRSARPTSFLVVFVLLLTIAVAMTLAGCGDETATPTPVLSAAVLPAATLPPIATSTPPVPPTNTPPPAPPTLHATSTPEFTAIPAGERGYVPVLCYHHIRAWLPSDTEEERAYIVPPGKLEAELKWLKENGYTSVTSAQVYEYVKNGRPLPSKPVMLSFDDDDDNQFTNARPLLLKYGFTATFFIMTVTIDKENYMTAEQLKQLDREGFDLQPHTWDHHIVTEYKTDADFQRQLVEPKQTLEDLLGHPTPFFAYPFGIYDAASAKKLEELGYKGAFRLRDVMDDAVAPEFAIKRYIANAYWTADQFANVVEGGWE